MALLIPLIGTRRTMLATAALLALAAAPALGRRYVLAPVAIAVLALIPPGLVKPGDGVHLRGRVALPVHPGACGSADGERVLHLNEGWAEHSVWRPHQVLTGGYWDQFLLAPPLHGARLPRPGDDRLCRRHRRPRLRRLLAVHERARDRARRRGHRGRPPLLGPGTTIRGCGWRRPTAAPTWQRHDDRYDAIFLDAFRQPYIPFYLTTQEFWGLTHERLRPGGMVMANVGRVPGDDRLPDAIAGTMATRFPPCRSWPVGGFNVIVAGFDAAGLGLPAALAPGRRRARAGPGVRDLADGLQPQPPSADPLTDDRAPVEWLTDQMIVRYADGG